MLVGGEESLQRGGLEESEEVRERRGVQHQSSHQSTRLAEEHALGQFGFGVGHFGKSFAHLMLLQKLLQSLH